MEHNDIYYKKYMKYKLKYLNLANRHKMNQQNSLSGGATTFIKAASNIKLSKDTTDQLKNVTKTVVTDLLNNAGMHEQLINNLLNIINSTDNNELKNKLIKTIVSNNELVKSIINYSPETTKIIQNIVCENKT
jgi:hypothetical protein